MRKRRKGYPSETRVKRGVRIVHGEIELAEKLGRNDLCPCGSGLRFQGVLPEIRPLRRFGTGLLFLEIDWSELRAKIGWKRLITLSRQSWPVSTRVNKAGGADGATFIDRVS